MIRLNPNLFILILIGMILSGSLIFIMTGSGLIPPLPGWVTNGFYSVLIIMFFWWPIDMMLHWEKRTAASIEKDKYIAMAVFSFLLFFVPWFWLVTPWLPTLVVALTIGIGLPMLKILIGKGVKRRRAIEPDQVYHIGMRCKGAQEFISYFPSPKKYTTGLSPSEGDYSHLYLHHRQAFEQIPNAQIDYVMDIVVDRKLGIHVIGKEKLECYFFINESKQAKIGFLPSSNIGRALDFGFSDSEVEQALEEVERNEQSWPALKEFPMMLQHTHGKVVPLP